MSDDMNNGSQPTQNMGDIETQALAEGAAHRTLQDELAAGVAVAEQANQRPGWSDEARQAWLETRLRFPAMGMCRR